MTDEAIDPASLQPPPVWQPSANLGGDNISFAPPVRIVNLQPAVMHGVIQTVPTVWFGIGAPANTFGNPYDIYFRWDGSTAGQYIYKKNGGVWASVA